MSRRGVMLVGLIMCSSLVVVVVAVVVVVEGHSQLLLSPSVILYCF